MIIISKHFKLSNKVYVDCNNFSNWDFRYSCDKTDFSRALQIDGILNLLQNYIHIALYSVQNEKFLSLYRGEELLIKVSFAD